MRFVKFIIILGIACSLAYWLGGLAGKSLVDRGMNLSTWVDGQAGKARGFFRGQPARKVAQVDSQQSDDTQNSSADSYPKPKAQVVEPGSTAAEYVIASVTSPEKYLQYHLNSVQPVANSKDLKVAWQIQNNLAQEVKLSKELRKKLNPRQLSVVDFSSDQRFTLKYDDYLPKTNCLLSGNIPMYGRLNCSAIVGPQFSELPGLQGQRVAVYLPGKKKPIKLFMDI